MKNTKNAKTLVAKVFGSMVFLSVFALNIMLFVQKDEKTGNLSAISLTANAQGEGGGDVVLDKDLEVDWVNGHGMTGWCWSCCPDQSHYCHTGQQTCGANNGDC